MVYGNGKETMALRLARSLYHRMELISMSAFQRN